jgi:hypothetical protein
MLESRQRNTEMFRIKKLFSDVYDKIYELKNTVENKLGHL